VELPSSGNGIAHEGGESLPSKVGSLAIFAAMRLASSIVNMRGVSVSPRLAGVAGFFFALLHPANAKASSGCLITGHTCRRGHAFCRRHTSRLRALPGFRWG
jgi:hypothetical protein